MFGDSTQRFLYLCADETFGAGGARARLHVRLSVPAVGTDVQLSWSYQSDKDWVSLGQSSTSADRLGDTDVALRDETMAFTRDGQVSFQIPLNWPRTLHRTRRGRWLRVEVSSDRSYRTAPQIEAIELGHEWVLPRLTGIALDGMSLIAVRAFNDFAYGAGTTTPFAPTADTEPAVYLGLDRPFDLRPIAIYLQVEPPRPEEVAADELAELDPEERAVLTWEYDGPAGWRPLDAQDETQGFSASGLVSFAAPKDLVERSRFGHQACWLRVRWVGGSFPLPPRLRRVLLNTMWASQAVTVVDESLGSSNGDPGQVFTTAQTPVLGGAQLLVRERAEPEETWERWDPQPDLYDSGPRDRHYTLDALTGSIQFGDGSAGLIPPPGQNNVRLTYRTGGGEQGNREAGAIAELRSAVMYVDGVANHEPAQGGAGPEPIERLKGADPARCATVTEPSRRRISRISPWPPHPMWRGRWPLCRRSTRTASRLGSRAVPTSDHVKADAGRFGVIVVPHADTDRPTPTVGLLREVRTSFAGPPPGHGHPVGRWSGVDRRARRSRAGPHVRRRRRCGRRAGAGSDRALPPSAHRRTRRSGMGVRTQAAPFRSLRPGDGRRGGRHRSPADGVPGARHHRPRPQVGPAEHAQPTADRAERSAETERHLQRWIDRALVYSGRHEIRVAP